MENFTNIFEKFRGKSATNSRRQQGTTRGEDLRYDLKLEFREAVFGGEKEIRINHLETCKTCQGTGAKPGARPVTCSTCGGIGQVRQPARTPFGSFTQLTTCPTCGGSGVVIEDRCESCGGQGHIQVSKKLKITIPAGVDNGTRLRVSGEGDAGLRGGLPGDLYVYLFVEPNPEFQREGNNIVSRIKISYLDAILGCRIPVSTVDGEVELKIPAGTDPCTVLTLEGRGVPRVGNPVARGDHLITVDVEIPKHISNEERELLEKLAKLRRKRMGKGDIDSFLSDLFRS